MSFAIYVVGAILLIGGLIYGATLLNVPNQWIAAGSVVALGLLVLTGVSATRQKDPAN